MKARCTSHEARHHSVAIVSRHPGRTVALWMLTCVVLVSTAKAGLFGLSRKSVLRDTANRAIVPACQSLLAQSRELTNAIGLLLRSPSPVTLVNSQDAWKRTMLAARAIQACEVGPLTERDAASTFFHSSILPLRVKEVLSTTQPINERYVEELGSPAKGMFALEYLLFGPRPQQEGAARFTPLKMFSGPEGRQLSAYLIALAKDVETRARQVAGDWTAPAGAPKVFIDGGQESVNTFVNQLAMQLEVAAENRLGFVLRLPEPINRQYQRVECSPSGISQQSVRAQISGIERLYRGSDGAGLDDLINQINPALARRIEAQFVATLSAIDALNAPLEDAVVKDRAALQSAYDKARALEILFKVDLASTLGVTITFGTNDGD